MKKSDKGRLVNVLTGVVIGMLIGVHYGYGPLQVVPYIDVILLGLAVFLGLKFLQVVK